MHASARSRRARSRFLATKVAIDEGPTFPAGRIALSNAPRPAESHRLAAASLAPTRCMGKHRPRINRPTGQPAPEGRTHREVVVVKVVAWVVQAAPTVRRTVSNANQCARANLQHVGEILAAHRARKLELDSTGGRSPLPRRPRPVAARPAGGRPTGHFLLRATPRRPTRPVPSSSTGPGSGMLAVKLTLSSANPSVTPLP
jgi:hypothetical protein